MVIYKKNDELASKSYSHFEDFDWLIKSQKAFLDSGIQTENQRKFSAGRIDASLTGKGKDISYV